MITGSTSGFATLASAGNLLYKQQCPSCFVPLHDPDLKPNRSMADAMEVISRLIPKIMSLLREVKPDFKLPTKSPVSKATPKVAKKEENVSVKPKILSQVDFDAPTPSTSTSIVENSNKTLPSPSGSFDIFYFHSHFLICLFTLVNNSSFG